jgi:uncharacterized membrane protein YfcA
MDTLSLLGLIAVGLCSGGVTGLIGASGVLIVVPVLTLLLGLPIHTAIGTSLAVDVIASTIVSIVYYKMGNVELRLGIGLALGTVIGAQVGSRIASARFIGIAMIVGLLPVLFFAVVLLIAALSTFILNRTGLNKTKTGKILAYVISIAVM